MTVIEVADRLRVSTNVVYSLLIEGKLRAYRVGGARPGHLCRWQSPRARE